MYQAETTSTALSLRSPHRSRPASHLLHAASSRVVPMLAGTGGDDMSSLSKDFSGRFWLLVHKKQISWDPFSDDDVVFDVRHIVSCPLVTTYRCKRTSGVYLPASRSHARPHARPPPPRASGRAASSSSSCGMTDSRSAPRCCLRDTPRFVFSIAIATSIAITVAPPTQQAEQQRAGALGDESGG